MDVHLTRNESKLNFILKVNFYLQMEVSRVKEASNVLSFKLSKVGSKVKLIEEDFDQLDLEFDELQTLMENTENNSKK